jgi:enoyl-CoA hydratase
MMFTGRALSAEEALRHGLVSRLVPPDALEDALAGIASAVTAAPSGALRLAKRCVDEGAELDPRGALATEILAIEENLAEGEWRRGMRAP